MSNTSSRASTPPRRRKKLQKSLGSKIESIQPSTSLPPAVSGQLRFFLRVTIKSFEWNLPNPPLGAILARIKWWGETEGTLFRPRVIGYRGRSSQALYAVRCGPDQFASYLADMSVLNIDVLLDYVSVGRAQVRDIQKLSFRQTLKARYSVVSTDSLIIGHIRAVFALESMIPALDSSEQVDVASNSVVSLSNEAINQFTHLCESKALEKSSKQHQTKLKEVSFDESLFTKENFSEDAPPSSEAQSVNSSTQDLIEILLNRGKQLKNSLIQTAAADEIQRRIPRLNDKPTNHCINKSSLPKKSPETNLQAYKSTKICNDDHSVRNSFDTNVLDIVLGDKFHGKDIEKFVMMTAGDMDSVSEDNFTDSEVDNPVHDNSILKELFYNNISKSIDSNNSLSDDELTSKDIEESLKTSHNEHKGSKPGLNKPPPAVSVVREFNQLSPDVNKTSKVESDKVLANLNFFLSIPYGDLAVDCNAYVVCRIFWLTDWLKSNVVWETNKPSFKFSNILPLILTNTLIERFKNNFIVIEVWNKIKTQTEDKLIGIVKIPTHQFYISMSNKKMFGIVLEGHYPLVCADSTFNIIDPISSQEKGVLVVNFAIGTFNQITAFKNSKGLDESISLSNRNFLISDFNEGDSSKCFAVEHSFEICLVGIKNLELDDKALWGEADCFIQYLFPHQNTKNPAKSTLSLKQFQSTTTLCVPNPTFNDLLSHKFILKEGHPIQHYLLSCVNAKNSSSTIDFEIWVRFYYPNLRDMRVAKGSMPLAKLCAMATLGSNSQNCGIRCCSITLSSDSHNMNSMGSLDLTVSYRSKKLCLLSELSDNQQNVTISVRVIRATGLQFPVNMLTSSYSNLQYYSQVGINAYVAVSFSFAPDDVKRTHSVAQNFAPDFESVLDFPVNIILEKRSLAEVLDNSFCHARLFHHTPANSKEMMMDSCPSNDILLCEVKIPLHDLLKRRTRLQNWFMMSSENESIKSCSSGGIELSIGFAKHDDYETVIEGGKSLGWTYPIDDIQFSDNTYMRFSIAIYELNCLDMSITDGYKAYIRLKFFDKSAITTHSALFHTNGNQIKCSLNFRKSYICSVGEALKHYMREEHLELQIWICPKRKSTSRRDKYFGSAFIPLISLFKSESSTSLSDSFPIFKPGVANLPQANVRLSLLAEYGQKTSFTSDMPDLDDSISESSTEEFEEKAKEFFNDADINKTFYAHVNIDTGYHLPSRLPLCSESELAQSTIYISFQLSDEHKPHVTEEKPWNKTVAFNYQVDTRLKNDHLKETNFPLVFKVWCKLCQNQSSVNEKLLGFVTVDLLPLTRGFAQVAGFYNILDIEGSIQGQLKIAIVPLEDIQAFSMNRSSLAKIKTFKSESEFVPKKPFENVSSNLNFEEVLSEKISELEALKRDLATKIRGTISKAGEILSEPTTSYNKDKLLLSNLAEENTLHTDPDLDNDSNKSGNDTSVWSDSHDNLLFTTEENSIGNEFSDTTRLRDEDAKLGNYSVLSNSLDLTTDEQDLYLVSERVLNDDYTLSNQRSISSVLSVDPSFSQSSVQYNEALTKNIDISVINALSIKESAPVLPTSHASNGESELSQMINFNQNLIDDFEMRSAFDPSSQRINQSPSDGTETVEQVTINSNSNPNVYCSSEKRLNPTKTFNPEIDVVSLETTNQHSFHNFIEHADADNQPQFLSDEASDASVQSTKPLFIASDNQCKNAIEIAGVVPKCNISIESDHSIESLISQNSTCDMKMESDIHPNAKDQCLDSNVNEISHIDDLPSFSYKDSQITIEPSISSLKDNSASVDIDDRNNTKLNDFIQPDSENNLIDLNFVENVIIGGDSQQLLCNEPFVKETSEPYLTEDNKCKYQEPVHLELENIDEPEISYCSSKTSICDNDKCEWPSEKVSGNLLETSPEIQTVINNYHSEVKNDECVEDYVEPFKAGNSYLLSPREHGDHMISGSHFQLTDFPQVNEELNDTKQSNQSSLSTSSKSSIRERAAQHIPSIDEAKRLARIFASKYT